MPVDESHERPPVRFPYVRREGAGHALSLILGAATLGVPLFLITRFFPKAHMFFNSVTVVAVLLLLAFILDYLKFEERCDIDAQTVRYSRKTLFGETAWSARLNTYRGIAVVTIKQKGPDEKAPARAHWSRRKPDRLLRLVHRDRDRTITLWEFDDRDFRDAVNQRLHSFSELLKLPILSADES